MQNNNLYKIYSTNLALEQNSLIEIETVILNGLYRFSILGINQKNSSDIKDRVYSALRYEKLLNLKSDNKKITVNLLPTMVDKKCNSCDLGIALSCMVQMGQIEFNNHILAVGELSIVGNILPSNHILKTIYQAIKNNIHIVVCSLSEIKLLDSDQNNMYDIIEKNKINFIVASTLKDIVEDIKDQRYYVFKNQENKTNSNLISEPFDIKDENIFKILLAVCTNRNVFIENKKDSHIKKFLKNLSYYNQRLSNSEILSIASNLNKTDGQIFDTHTVPSVSIIDSQTNKDDLQVLLSESLYGFNIVHDFISLPEDILYITKKIHKSAILCFYNSCPCGNNNNLFNSFEDDKCICLQRTILRYRQKLLRLENKFFDFYVKESSNLSIEYSPMDYILANKAISSFRSWEHEIEWYPEANKSLINLQNQFEKGELDTIGYLAVDIIKLRYILGETKKPIVLADTIDLAVQLIKKGF